MRYYEPYNLLIFCLLSKEVQLFSIENYGTQVKYVKYDSLQLDNICQTIIVNTHKVTNNVLLIIGTSITLESKTLSEIVIYELNPDNNFKMEPHRSFSLLWPHQSISNLLYNSSFGLISTSSAGAIEIFDAIDLNVSLWNNEDTMQKNKY